ncbi:MAG: histidine kinase [Marinoscillum sp.]
MLKPLLFIGLLLTCGYSSNAQDPSHFIIGANELADVDVYSITQGQSRDYWLATDHGVVRYDGYKFETIHAPEMADKSVFGWVKDDDQTLYCFNLSGQIFRVFKDKIDEFFKIPDSLMYRDISFEFDNQGKLIVVANSILEVDESGDFRILYGGTNRGIFSKVFRRNDGVLLVHDARSHNLIEISDGEISKSALKHRSNQSSYINFLYLRDSLLYFDKSTSRLLNISQDSVHFGKSIQRDNQDGYYRFYAAGDQLYALSSTGGFMLYDHQLEPLYGQKVLLRNEFISTSYKDLDGNLIMGTFKSGLYVIPDINIMNMGFTLADSKFTGITNSPNHLYLGTQAGEVLVLNKDEEEISAFQSNQTKSIELLAYLDATNELFIDDLRPFLVNLGNGDHRVLGMGTIKDIEDIGDAYLFSSSVGVFIYDYKNRYGSHRVLNSLATHSPDIHVLDNFRERTYCANVDRSRAIVYAGTSVGLKIQDRDSATYFQLNGIQLNCSEIKPHENHMYVATLNNGILIFEGGELVRQLNTETGLLSNTIYRIQFYQDRLFAATEKGVQILSADGSPIGSITRSDGLVSDKVIDFVVADDALWLLEKNGLLKIRLDEIVPFTFVPEILRLVVLQDGDTVSHSVNPRFRHNQSRFEFNVKAPSLRFQNEISYHYQLIGLDEIWHQKEYLDNKITYVSLPPGAYEFRVKAVCRDVESELVSYGFIINPPFYNSWWFYLLSLLFTLLVSGAVFTMIYLRQKRKTQFQNELNESKLSAIRSQMNPHFIFNALNSIQDYIVLNEKKLASKFMGKFADLMRIYLNHSQLKSISVKEEVEALTLYLELEKLRFESLHFSIDVSLNLDPDLLEIPTLIIQPYVENALKHGLLHKKGEKRLSVAFTYEEQDHVVQCVVSDNGIGRRTSEQINRIRNPKHQSFATKATRNRLTILNAQSDRELQERIIDRYDDQEQSLGTEVVLRIPVLN